MKRIRQIATHAGCGGAAPAAPAAPAAAPAATARAPPATIHELRTPAYVVRLPVARANSERMLARASRLGCTLRPHVKTHKTLELGAMQTGGSCRGITCSTLAEVEFFADGGFDDIVYGAAQALKHGTVRSHEQLMPLPQALIVRAPMLASRSRPDHTGQVPGRGGADCPAGKILYHGGLRGDGGGGLRTAPTGRGQAVVRAADGRLVRRPTYSAGGWG